MGIPGLWDILGEGEVKSLAELSTDHYKKTGRPLRVAIDEAGWRFHNLNDAQVAAIRQKVPEANPIEKAILWRLLKLMRMNIQPIFVFDGPSRPWKRGSVAGRIDWKKIDLLRKTLDALKIPHHRAPAEAEAECARLNDLGIVDAVWSDDGDALMFGAKVLIKEHREGSNKTVKKSDNLIRIYRAVTIEQKHRINRQGLILFALLSGGDYDTKGLPGCGPIAALEAAHFDNGRLGKILCETPLRQLHCFTESLRSYFQMSGTRNVHVPPGYPRDLHVKNYREPRVSTLEAANNLRGLKNGWNVHFDEKKLRTFLLERFNFTTREYLRHIVPVSLAKDLIQSTPETTSKNLVFEIELVHKRGRNHDDPCLERQITFGPKRCTELDLWTQPDNEDWAALATMTGGPFDPTLPVETEFLEYVLVGGLGEAEMQRLKQAASQPNPRKRKPQDNQAEYGSRASTESSATVTRPPAKRQEKPAASTAESVNLSQTIAGDVAIANPTTTRKPTKKHGEDIEIVPPVEPRAPPPPVKKGFQLPRALVRNPSMLAEIVSQSSQGLLSSSAIYQLSESRPVPSRETSGSATSTSLSGAPSQPRKTSSSAGIVQPSSQYHPELSSWVTAAPQSAVFLEDTPSPEPTISFAPEPSSTQPSHKAPPPPITRGRIVVDILDDDDKDESPPALYSAAHRLIATQAGKRDERQQIAAARVKHFEQVAMQDDLQEATTTATDKRARETIDLTLDD